MKYIKTDNYIKKEAQYNLPGDPNLPPGMIGSELEPPEPKSQQGSGTYSILIGNNEYNVLVNYDITDYSKDELNQDIDIDLDIQTITDSNGKDVTTIFNEEYIDDVKIQIETAIKEARI